MRTLLHMNVMARKEHENIQIKHRDNSAADGRGLPWVDEVRYLGIKCIFTSDEIGTFIKSVCTE